MSINSNFRKNKCWSCEFFCGRREYKNGLFSPHVSTDGSGVCGCSRGPDSKKRVNEDHWCSKYQKWGVLEAYLANERYKEQQRLEERRIQEERRKAIEAQERQERQLRAERERLRKERERLEHENYLASLSPEERAKAEAEDARKIEEAKAKAEAAIAYSRALREREKKAEELEAKKKRCKSLKRQPMIWGVVMAAVVLLAFFLSWIPHWKALADKNGAEQSLKLWIGLGHSATDQYGLKYQAQINEANERVASTFPIPFVVLVIGLVVVALVVILLVKSKRRKNALSEAEREIAGIEESLSEQATTTISEAIKTEETEDTCTTTHKIMVGGVPMGEVVIESTIGKPKSAEEVFLNEYNEEFAFLKFLHKYPSIKIAAELSEGDYPHWMFMSCGVKEVKKLHDQLEEKGMYIEANPTSFLSVYKVDKLREIASAAGIQVRGKKDDIQSQLASALGYEDLVKYSGDHVEMLSNAAKEYMKERELKWEYFNSDDYQKRPFEDYEKERENKSRGDMDVERLTKEIESEEDVNNRNSYYARSGVYEAAGEHELALLDLLMVLRLDLSGVCAYKSIKEFGDEFKDPNNANIMFAPGLLNDIQSKKDWFKPSMIEKVYQKELPLDATNQLLFMEIVTRILNEKLDNESMAKYTAELLERFKEAVKEI